jgi:charged multivesicular body protein 2A
MAFWKSKPTARETANNAKKETKREVRSGQREIEREIRDLERQEKKIMMEIKQRAKQPGVNGKNDNGLKSMAKNLVQVRNQRDKMYGVKAQLGAVGMQASAMASQVAASSAVGSVAGAMKTANGAVDATEMAKIMNEFTRQNEVMEIRQEMMDDALTDAFDSEGVEEEADEVTGQVLAELGIEMDKQFVGLATPSAMPAGQQVAEEEDNLPDLKARLDAL